MPGVSVSDRFFAAEGRWLMGRVIPHELLKGIDRHLTVVAPGREEELVKRVGRCQFRDFFARHDATLVTTVLCSWDANWMRALDPAVTGLRAERTSLLSLGDDACRFRVAGTDDPLASYEDALDRRFGAA